MSGPSHPSGHIPRRTVPATAAAAEAAQVAGVAGAPATHAADQRGMCGGTPPLLRARNVDPRTGAVDPNKIILSWFGVSSFAMAIRGTVVLLDAWVPRGVFSGYVPTSAAEVARLRPRALFLGRGHFDHGGDTAFIAARSNAVVVGTREMCREVTDQAPDGVRIRTRPIGDESHSPPGTRYDTRIAVAGFGGRGVHGYNALEGTFPGGCIFSGRAAGRALARDLG